MKKLCSNSVTGEHRREANYHQREPNGDKRPGVACRTRVASEKRKKPAPCRGFSVPGGGGGGYCDVKGDGFLLGVW